MFEFQVLSFSVEVCHARWLINFLLSTVAFYLASLVQFLSHNMSDEEFAAASTDSEQETESEPLDPRLPERGLFPDTKTFLISKLDEEGGLQKVNRSNNLLDSICNKYPEELGESGTELRLRVKTVAAHWKRKPKLYASARKLASNTTTRTAAPKVPPAAAPVVEIQEEAPNKNKKKMPSANLFSSPSRGRGRRKSVIGMLPVVNSAVEFIGAATLLCFSHLLPSSFYNFFQTMMMMIGSILSTSLAICSTRASLSKLETISLP